MSQILPFLFLGNSRDASSKPWFNQHNIRYVLNCTVEIRNAFEQYETIRYYNIRIDDYESEPIDSHFDGAFQFIDEAKEEYEKALAAGDPNPPKILVHCMAGVSRSATITIAYYMKTHRVPLLEAFKYVKSKRQIISPNSGFIAKLYTLSFTLGLGSKSEIESIGQRLEEAAEKIVAVTSDNSKQNSFCDYPSFILRSDFNRDLNLLRQMVVSDPELSAFKDNLLQKFLEVDEKMRNAIM